MTVNVPDGSPVTNGRSAMGAVVGALEEATSGIAKAALAILLAVRLISACRRASETVVDTDGSVTGGTVLADRSRVAMVMVSA